MTIDDDHMADGGVLAADPNNDSIFWSGGKWYYMSACVSTDEGWTWNRYNPSPYEGWAYTIAIDPTSSNTVYVGGIPCIYRTTDFGQTWDSCSIGMTGYAYDMAIHPLDPDFIVAGTCDGIFISSDAGGTWAARGCSNVNALLLNPLSKDTIIAATDNGVWRTEDQGITWLNMGLDSQYVRSLEINPDTYYYVGTYGSGVFRWAINVGTKERADMNPARFTISVHPNPFSRATCFTYTLSSPGNVRLSIYDVTGRHVHTVLDVYQNSGQYTIQWNGQDVHGDGCVPGIYFYRWTTKQAIESGSLILSP
ncbi:T9SS type A sorting domain-containing protein [candidate division WOR-3 bacterium]|nr:T9SS type A sorting domain-containing protein [candidate division WOR-3 bacterium]